MATVKVNWTRKIFDGGRGWHVGSLVCWKGAYHVCFVDGSGHGSGDSQIRVCSSADLETWTSQIALGAKTIDPNLLPVGDRLLVYGVRLSREEAEGQPEPEYGFTSQQIVAATTDGKTWSQPRRCFVMNHDFWHPVEHEGRYWVACDTVGHTPHASHNSVDLLVSDDGERWQWVSEIIHGTTHPEYRDSTGLEFGVQAPSETSLCFGEDQRLLAVTRARGYCALRPAFYRAAALRPMGAHLVAGIALLRLGHSPSGPPRTRHRPQLQQRRDSGYGGPIQRTF